MRRVGLVLGGLTGVAAGLASAGGGGDGVFATTVIKTGDAAPGVPGLTVGLAGGGVINDAGQVMSSIRLSGSGVVFGNDDAIVAGFPGALSKVLRENDPVPSLPDFIFKPGNINLVGVNDFVLASDGSIGFSATMLNTVNGSFNLNGVFSGTAGGVLPALYDTGPVPGFPGSTYVYEPAMTMHSGGRISVAGRAFTANERAVWFGTPGNMTAALQSGLLAPGITTGAVIGSFDSDSLRMDDTGDIMFSVTLDLGSGVTQSNRRLIYEGDPSNLGILARTGDLVPGIPGAVYSALERDTFRMNAAGARCFIARVSGGGTTAAIISCGAGGCFTLAKNGDPVPGLPGVTLTQLEFANIDLNGLGQVAFSARLAGAPSDADSAVFIGGPGGFEMVLREGDLLPNGTPVSHLGNAFWTFNDRGQFVFELFEDGRAALYATRPNGEIVRLARSTEGFATDDGTAGVLSATNPWSINRQSRYPGSGGSSVFNNNGEFLISMRFTGSSGSALVVIDIDDPCVADFSAPFGTLNFFDLGEFLNAFNAQDPSADLADPVGVFNFFDLGAFLTAFNGGCPD